MIFEIIQIKNGYDPEWIAVGENKGDRFAVEIAILNSSGALEANITAEDYQQKLVYNPQDSSFGSQLTARLTWRLFEEGKIVGSMLQKTHKVGKWYQFQSYSYDEIKYLDDMYWGYEVGLGKNGLFLCIYLNDEQVALVEKDLKVVNYKDTYKCYLLDEKYAKMVIPYVIKYDMQKFDNMDERSMRSVKYYKVNTFQKELLAKYDASFIDRVIALENNY